MIGSFLKYAVVMMKEEEEEEEEENDRWARRLFINIPERAKNAAPSILSRRITSSTRGRHKVRQIRGLPYYLEDTSQFT